MKIISYIMMALGFLGWISLYPLTVLLKDSEHLDPILFVTGYIFIIITIPISLRKIFYYENFSCKSNMIIIWYKIFIVFIIVNTLLI